MLNGTNNRRLWVLAAVGVAAMASAALVDSSAMADETVAMPESSTMPEPGAMPLSAPLSVIVGRWDITVTGTITNHDKDGKIISSQVQTYPMWLGIQEKDGKLAAQCVGKGGGVRQIDPPRFENGMLTFKVKNREWVGKVIGDTIEGVSDKGGDKWVARRYVPSIDVTGKWNLKVGDEPATLSLFQMGKRVNGRLMDSEQQGVLVKGRAHDNDLYLRAEAKFFSLNIKGDATEGKVAEGGIPITGTRERKWGKPIVLFDGKPEDMDNWEPREGKQLSWSAVDGVLTNGRRRTENIVTKRKDFWNFKLHVEFKVPEQGNSGVYLRGRYEIQVEDSFGKPAGNLDCGGLYGRIAPKVNACKKAGEWQIYDITLIDNYVTVVHNGQTVIDNREVVGITGGAIDCNEDRPGPIYLQGDHSQAFYRKIILTPAE